MPAMVPLLPPPKSGNILLTAKLYRTNRSYSYFKYIIEVCIKFNSYEYVFQACKGSNKSYTAGADQKDVSLIPCDTFTIPFAPDMLISYTTVEGI